VTKKKTDVGHLLKLWKALQKFTSELLKRMTTVVD